VWPAEARRGRELGGLRSGHTPLDLGCDPGFCTLEMAYLVGVQGQVIGVDFAASYIDFLRKQSELRGVLKKNGQAVTTAERTISADGMTMQLVSNVTRADGSTVRNVAVYDLQC